MDEKYVVFKLADFEGWWLHSVQPRLAPSEAALPEALEDAVVIRKQDLFAGPGLHAYASAIQTAIDLIGLLPGEDFSLTTSLEDLRDYFAQQAMDADNWPTKKVPD